MIKGVGIDIIEIERIQQIITKQKRFTERILTKNERQQFDRLTGRRQLEFLAGRFAAKEAYAKAKGTGFGKDLSFQDIEVLSDSLGKPILHADDPETIHLSISHSKDYAVAQVIIEKT